MKAKRSAGDTVLHHYLPPLLDEKKKKEEENREGARCGKTGSRVWNEIIIIPVLRGEIQFFRQAGWLPAYVWDDKPPPEAPRLIDKFAN